MSKEKVSVEINRIPLDKLSLENVSALEAGLIAKDVENRMRELETETEVIDTLKLALMAAMSFAAELQNAKQENEQTRLTAENQLNAMKRHPFVRASDIAHGHTPPRPRALHKLFHTLRRAEVAVPDDVSHRGHQPFQQNLRTLHPSFRQHGQYRPRLHT